MTSEASALERILKRDRILTGAALAALCVLAWVYLVSGAGMGMSAADATRLSLFPHKLAGAAAGPAPMAGMDMAGMDMGAAAPAAPIPGFAAWALTVGMWLSMMVAMMAPAAAPVILLYARVRGAQAKAGGTVAPTGLFALGYGLVWLGFSVLAATLQIRLQADGVLAPLFMSSQSRWLSAAVLIGAGVYQFTPLKLACLGRCRAPVDVLTRYYRPGRIGAVSLGMRHGADCVGCCWALMILLFVGGVMNLAWIAALTVLVAAEKLAPAGPWIGRITGAVLVAWGLATALV